MFIIIQSGFLLSIHLSHVICWKQIVHQPKRIVCLSETVSVLNIGDGPEWVDAKFIVSHI